MAQTTARRFALEEIKRSLALIRTDRGYPVTVATIRSHVFDREDIHKLGALPAVGFAPQRERVEQYEPFGRMRVIMPIAVTVVVAAATWEAGVLALDDMHDAVIAALSTEPTLGNDFAHIIYTGAEDDSGAPDYLDSRGGSMGMLLYFDVCYYRTVLQVKT